MLGNAAKVTDPSAPLKRRAEPFGLVFRRRDDNMYYRCSKNSAEVMILFLYQTRDGAIVITDETGPKRPPTSSGGDHDQVVFLPFVGEHFRYSACTEGPVLAGSGEPQATAGRYYWAFWRHTV